MKSQNGVGCLWKEDCCLARENCWQIGQRVEKGKMTQFPWDTYAGTWRICVLILLLLFHDPKLSISWHMCLRERFQHVPFTAEYSRFISAQFIEAKECLGLLMEAVKEWPIISVHKLAENKHHKIYFSKKIYFPNNEVQLYSKATGLDFHK